MDRMDRTISTQTAPSPLAVEVPLARLHSSDRVAVEAAATTVTIPLVAGSGVATTAPRMIGHAADFTNPRLMATLSVWYDYDPASRVLTLCGPDLVSPDSTRLDTFPIGSDRIARYHTYSGYPAPVRERPAWNYSAEFAPGLAEAFQETARLAQREVIAAAEAQGLNVALRTPLPPLSPRQLADLRLVYHRGVFKKAYRPGEPLDEGDSIVAVESVWGGTVRFQPSEAFANVIGSTGDPHIAGLSWIALWRNQFGFPPQCTSLAFPAGFNCTPQGGNSPLGGHVITGTQAQQVPYGANYVYIFPICSAHNNNDNVYMEALQTLDGIWLKNYHQ
jgi:hypothetical protein